MYVLDFHGLMISTHESPYLTKYFTKQFGFKHYSNYTSGFFLNQATSLPNSNELLIEYSENNYSYNYVINVNYIGKIYNTIINLIKDKTNSNNKEIHNCFSNRIECKK